VWLAVLTVSTQKCPSEKQNAFTPIISDLVATSHVTVSLYLTDNDEVYSLNLLTGATFCRCLIGNLVRRPSRVVSHLLFAVSTLYVTQCRDKRRVSRSVFLLCYIQPFIIPDYAANHSFYVRLHCRGGVYMLHLCGG
jgi:hypothetical protein